MAKKKAEDTMAEKDETATATAEAPEHVHGPDCDHDHDHDHHHHHHDEEAFEFVEDPTFAVEYKGECAYEVKVSVPSANVAKQAETLLADLAGEAVIPGFRPGRAPRKLIENKFGKHIRSEAHSKLVGAAFQRLIQTESLRPLALPDVDGLEDLDKIPAGGPLDFTLKFEVLPRVELGDAGKITVDRPIVKINKKDVQEAIDEIRGRHSAFETLEKGKAAEGDQVIIDFTGTVDGVAFEGGAAEQYPYILGTNRFFQEFEDVLAGCKTGDELSCDVTLPEELPNKAIAGKSAHFVIKVGEIKRKKLPDFTDEFAKEAGYESKKDMEEKVESRLRESVDRQSGQVAEARAVDALVEASTFELPKTMIDAATSDYYTEELRRLYQERVPASEVQAREEEIRNSCREQAIQEIKRVVAVNTFGEAEKITVTEEDFENEISSLVSQTGMQAELIAQYFAQEQNRTNAADRIYRTKTIAALMTKVKTKDVELKDEDAEVKKDA